MNDPRELVALAESAVDHVADLFVAGLGAPPAVFKGDTDFATEVDLRIEKELRATLTQLTGIGVYGEESGGTLSDTIWVVDPIDGTANYSAGSPLCGILVSLVHEARPVAAVADFPLLRRRLVAAEGGTFRSFGGAHPSDVVGQAAPGSTTPGHGFVGCSSYLATEIFHGLRVTGLRPRMTGSVGLDNAFVAQGVFDGTVNFSPHAWDNAAGALLVKAAGGVVTDASGEEWNAYSTSFVAGTPRTHEIILDVISQHSP